MDDGSEVEAFTAEEVSAQIKAKEDENIQLKKDLEALKGKGDSFSTLKAGFETEIKKKDEEIGALKTTLDTHINKTVTETKTEIFNALAQGDKDLSEKIEAEFNGFSGTVTTKAEIIERAKKAYSIVSPATAPSAIDAFMSGTGGRGLPVKPNNSTTETPEQAEIRRKMGISDADFAKYGNQNNK